MIRNDGLNRQVASTSPSLAGQPARTLSVFDPNGNLTQTVDALGQASKMVYDAANRLTSSTDAKDQTTSFSYDTLGNQASVTDPRSIRSKYSYDQLNRLTLESVVTGINGTTDLISSRTFEYDILV